MSTKVRSAMRQAFLHRSRRAGACGRILARHIGAAKPPKTIEVGLQYLRKLLNSGRGFSEQPLASKFKRSLCRRMEGPLAPGKRDLLGMDAVAASMVPGARIELATPAFSGRRSTNELPRQLMQP